MQILLFNLAALLGAGAQGLTGFGSGTIAVTALALLFPFREVVPAVALVVIVPNLMLAWLARHDLDWRRGPIAALGLVLGIAAGAYLLAILPVDWLRRGLGGVILIYVAVTLLRTPAPESMPRFTPGDAGALGLASLGSGVIVGAVGVSPIPMLVYITTRYPKHRARAVLTQAFVVGSLVQNLIYLKLGLLTADLALLALATVPGIFIGLLVGNRWHYRVNQRTFSRALALILILPATELLFGSA